MNALTAVTEKIRLNLIARKIVRRVRGNQHRGEAVVLLEQKNVMKTTRNVEQLKKFCTDKEDALFVTENGLFGLACRSRQYEIAAEIAHMLMQRSPSIIVTLSLPFSEGDDVMMNVGDAASEGTIVMQTSPSTYAVRMKVDGTIRKRVHITKLRAGGSSRIKVHLSVPLRALGNSLDDFKLFCKGFCMMGSDTVWQLFPQGIQHGAPAESDLSRLPGLFSGSGEHARCAVYALTKLLTLYASQREKLVLDGNWMGPSGLNELMRPLQNMRRLGELRIGKNGIGPDGIKALTALLRLPDGLPRLTVLDLRRNALGSEGIRQITVALVRRYRRRESASSKDDSVLLPLRELDLSSNFAGDSGGKHVAEALPFLKGLEVLRVRGNDLSCVGLKLICDALAMPLSMTQSALFSSKLHELDISHNEATPLGVAHLAAAISRCVTTQCPTIPLRVLNVRMTRMASDGIRELTRMSSSMPHLEVLDVSSNEIDFGGGEALLSFVATLSSLRTVRFGNNAIGVRTKRAMGTILSRRRSSNSLALMTRKKSNTKTNKSIFNLIEP